jgi:hypothetical protein
MNAFGHSRGTMDISKVHTYLALHYEMASLSFF